MNVKQLFLLSSALSIITVYIFHFFFLENIELDLVSHFFGGFSAMIVINELSNHLPIITLKNSIILLIMCILVFELLEHLTFTYVLTEVYLFYNLDYIKQPEFIKDTIGDIIAGFIGGIVYIKWGHKFVNRP